MRYPNDYSVEVTKAWHSMESQGMAWKFKGMACQGKAWHGMERQGKAMCIEISRLSEVINWLEV
jgi:hypothetical protein